MNTAVAERELDPTWMIAAKRADPAAIKQTVVGEITRIERILGRDPGRSRERVAPISKRKPRLAGTVAAGEPIIGQVVRRFADHHRLRRTVEEIAEAGRPVDGVGIDDRTVQARARTATTDRERTGFVGR